MNTLQDSANSRNFIAMIQSHFDRIIEKGTDRYGGECSLMWMASLDTRTGEYCGNIPHAVDNNMEYDSGIVPKGCTLQDGKRVYRNIDAPDGCSLYWDQPSIVAAYALKDYSGNRRYETAAEDYIKAFLEKCVAKNGIFLWGNHYYYNAFMDKTVWFISDDDPKPCDIEKETGWLHEARPIPPAWETFWRIDPKATERCIRQLGVAHMFDMESGGFNRHADGKAGCAFLESGGILVEMLCWLYQKTKDLSLVDRAKCIAEYSWRNRNINTGLLENNPTETRWDKHTSTTEVGLWAGSLLRAEQYCGVKEFETMACNAVLAYLKYGFDGSSGRYYGRLDVRDGSPELGPKDTLYQPNVYSDIWDPIFPTHDYPMALAESALMLYQRTDRDEFKEAVERWVDIIRREIPARGGKGGYAEHYGRGIHFLNKAYHIFGRKEWLNLAFALADEAVEKLFDHGMFRGHPGEDRYDAVDGVGYLMLALMHLQTGNEPDYMGFGF